jgi:beta-fructofuranosidase
MRPTFHFTADSGWINDPHGITFRDGSYHQFHQFVPDSLVWKPNCHWGHAVGRDLFSLEHRPVAIAPGEGDDGIWTGSVVTDDRGSRIFYTSVVEPGIGIGRVRVASPDDESWDSWTKGRVLFDAPESLDIVAYRDPFVFRDDAVWRMLVGAGLRDGTAAAVAYSSSDLETWTFDGVAAARSTTESDPVWTGSLWECPQLIDMGDAHLLVTSVWDDDVLHYAAFAVGAYCDGHFDPETWGQLTYGLSYYAPSFFRDALGRACLIFWMRGVRDTEVGWSGAHSLPYLLSLEDGELHVAPHPDLDKYRQPTEDGNVLGSAADVHWDPGAAGILLVSDATTARLSVEATKERVTVSGEGIESLSCPRRSKGAVRVIIDGPVLEIVVDGHLLGAAIAPLVGPKFEGGGVLDVFELVRMPNT